QRGASPLNLGARAIPSALLPVAVGPTIATRTSGPVTPLPARAATRAPRALRAAPAARSAACASAGSSRAGIFVEVERDREEGAIVRVLRGKGLRRGGRRERTESGVVERVDRRGPQHPQR